MADLVSLLNNNFLSECLGLLLASVATGIAVKLGFSEWKAGAVAALTVIALYFVKLVFTDASRWGAFVAVLPAIILVVWMVVVGHLLQRTWRKRRAVVIAEDCAWSSNPFRFLSITPVNCDINIGIRAVSLRIRIANQYDRSRFVCVTTNVAVYRHGAETPLCTLTVPVVSALVGAGETVDAAPIWQATMVRAEANEIAAVYKLDGRIQVRLVQVKITTLVDLTGDPKAVTNALALLTPVDVDHFYLE
jgi:hypothetical protein